MKKLFRYYFSLGHVATLTVNANSRTDAYQAAKELEKAAGMDLFDRYEMSSGALGEFAAKPAADLVPELTPAGEDRIKAHIEALQALLIKHAY